MTSFGEYIRKTRESKGLTLNQVATYSGISSAQLSRIENGKRGVPKPDTIEKIASALKVDYNELMMVAGYIDPNETFGENNIPYPPEVLKVFEEIMKHPVAFENLKANPEKNVKQMIQSWSKVKEMLKEIDEDDGDYLE